MSWPARGVFLVAQLVSILRHVSNHQVTCCGIYPAVNAKISSAGLDSTAYHTGGRIKLSQLNTTFQRVCLASVCSTMCVMRPLSECVRVRTTLGALPACSLFSRPLLCESFGL